jgi:hypothetical protein
VQRTADAQDLILLEIGDTASETALLFAEFYRRDGEWRVRAIGQGYSGGLAALVADFGVDVAAEPAEIEPDETPDVEDAQPPTPSSADQASDVIDLPPEQAPQVPEETEAETTASRPVSVRRPARAPRLPADWDQSIPASDGNDWQAARLFPVAGIGGAGTPSHIRAPSCDDGGTGVRSRRDRSVRSTRRFPRRVHRGAVRPGRGGIPPGADAKVLGTAFSGHHWRPLRRLSRRPRFHGLVTMVLHGRVGPHLDHHRPARRASDPALHH